MFFANTRCFEGLSASKLKSKNKSQVARPSTTISLRVSPSTSGSGPMLIDGVDNNDTSKYFLLECWPRFSN